MVSSEWLMVSVCGLGNCSQLTTDHNSQLTPAYLLLTTDPSPQTLSVSITIVVFRLVTVEYFFAEITYYRY